MTRDKASSYVRNHPEAGYRLHSEHELSTTQFVRELLVPLGMNLRAEGERVFVFLFLPPGRVSAVPARLDAWLGEALVLAT
jgi:hypothetical protein